MKLSNAVMQVLYWNSVDIKFRANRSAGSKGEMKTNSTDRVVVSSKIHLFIVFLRKAGSK